MKTPEQLYNEYKGFHNMTTVEFFAEIQRDAREGMVANADLQDLLRCLWKSDSNGYLPEEASLAFEKLRAKHPNLFTK